MRENVVSDPVMAIEREIQFHLSEAVLTLNATIGLKPNECMEVVNMAYKHWLDIREKHSHIEEDGWVKAEWEV